MSFPFLKRPSKHSPVNISSLPSTQQNHDDNNDGNEDSHDDDVEMSAFPAIAEVYLPNVDGSGAVGKQDQKNPNSAVENPMVRPTVSGKNKPSFDLKPYDKVETFDKNEFIHDDDDNDGGGSVGDGRALYTNNNQQKNQILFERIGVFNEERNRQNNKEFC
jgi:hypothetical protein